MPITVSLDQAKRIIYTRASDLVSVDDLIAQLEQLRDYFRNGVLDETWAQILDYRQVTGAKHVASTDIRRLADLNPFPNGLPRVMIAPAAEVFGLGRMYELLVGGGDHLQIVRTTEEASAWLAARGWTVELSAS